MSLEKRAGREPVDYYEPRVRLEQHIKQRLFARKPAGTAMSVFVRSILVRYLDDDPAEPLADNIHIGRPEKRKRGSKKTGK